MKKALSLLSLALVATMSFSAQAYDADMAAKIAPMAARLDHATLASGKGCKVSAEDVLKMRAKKEKITLLDVRTDAEAKVVAMPDAIHIPMDRLLRPENLAKLPTDGKLIVVCHSGNRATGSTALLNAIGFKNAVYVNGGLIALTTSTTPATVPVE